MDDALGRAEAYRAAGADVLLVMAHKAEDFRTLGERLAPPLMTLTSDGQLRKMGLTKADLAALGFRLLVDAISPVLLFHKTMKRCYQAIANGESAAMFAPEGLGREQNELHQTIDLDELLAIERETVEK
jgi:methylisocitrate lyase